MTKILFYIALFLSMYSSYAKTILVGGYFDILHIGHIRFLHDAKSKGDELIVMLEDHDKMIKTKKRYPIHTTAETLEILNSLECVDDVVIVPEFTNDLYMQYHDLIDDISPDAIALTKGDQFFEIKKKHAEELGIELIILDPTPYISSSEILSRGKQMSQKYTGLVIRGKKFASKILDLPTANLLVSNLNQKSGLYRCSASLNSKKYKAICYIEDPRKQIIEVHLKDFNQNLYTKDLTVILEEYIRPPIFFDYKNDLESLKKQINIDKNFILEN